MTARMAAIFALVFVPCLFAVIFMIGSATASVAVIAATTIFVALATGMLTGLFRLAHSWEGE